MSLRSSQEKNQLSYSSVRPCGSSIRSQKLFGWIDLDKVRPKITFLLVIALAGATALGAVFYADATADDSPGAAAANSPFAWINPFAWHRRAEETELMLAKEYLYADSRLFAVEDAGATPVPPADLAIWRPSTGQWWTMAGENSRQVTVSWGAPGDIPAIGDYDGDGKTDFCIFRPREGRWYLIKSSSGDSSTSVTTFGRSGDIPASADFDGDGKTDMAVWRPSNGNWYIMRSSDNGLTQVPLGIEQDTPNPKDYDGDGKADLAVWRLETKTFYSVNSSDGELQFTHLGSPGEPVSADYDGDGTDDFAIRNGSLWKILRSSDGGTQESSWQNSQDISVQNDYDGDGRVDIAVWRSSDGRWFIDQSSDGSTRIEQWGATGDIPLPALYRR